MDTFPTETAKKESPFAQSVSWIIIISQRFDMSTLQFNPANSKVSDAKLVEFLTTSLTGDLNEVPGIGPATIKLLANTSISIDNKGNTTVIPAVTTTFGLIGIYLSFKNDPDHVVGPFEHAERFFTWLVSLGTPTGFRAGIVHAICEKVNVSYPGIYDSGSSVYTNDA